MTCQNCGFECDNQADVCPKCGNPLKIAGQNGYYQQANNQQYGYNQQTGTNQQYQNNGYNQQYQNNGYNQQYQNNGYNQQHQNNGFNQQFNGNGYRVPIKNKNIVVCIILSIITCGIYGIVWFVNLVDDLNQAAGTPNDTSGITVFLLTFITCGIYGFYWFYKAGEKVGYIHQRRGLVAESSTSILYLLLAIFGFSIVNYALIQNELNQVAMQ